jgi:hypothetical protein
LTGATAVTPPLAERLEWLVRAASGRRPGRVVVALEDVILQPGAASTPEVRFEDPGSPDFLGASAIDASGQLRATLRFANTHPAPAAAPGPREVPELSGPENAPLLYAREQERVFEASPPWQVLSRVRWEGLGQLCAELTHASSVMPAAMGSQQAAPATVEGLVQLARWLWYAFAGEASEPARLDALLLLRLPRSGEDLRATARLTGSCEGRPCIELSATTPDGSPLVAIRRLQLLPRPLPDAGAMPRTGWQAFMRSVGAVAPVGGP